VALALRAAGGPLQGYPISSTRLAEAELQKWVAQGKLPLLTLEDWPQAAGAWQVETSARQMQAVYFGCYAPHAVQVSLVGSFNRWLPGRLPLQRAANGWWHGALLLPPGAHTYRFWLAAPDPATGGTAGFWRRDDENPARCDSGYHDDHSLIVM
jgi:hypothetical protein